MSATLDDVEANLERGFHVFPVDSPETTECTGVRTKNHDPATCTKRGKHPCVQHFTTDATSDYQEAVSHFIGAGARNVGVRTGGGLIVLDEDQPDALARYAHEHGHTIPTTYTVTTGKGRHYYFRTDQDVTNQTGALGRYGIDVRGTNGYVVAAGSLHHTGALYAVESDAPVAALPSWALEAIQARPASPDTTQGARGLASIDEVIPEGQRHHQVVRYASSLRARETPAAEAEVLTRAVWERCAQPPNAATPYEWDEAVGTLRDVYTRYPAGRSAEYQRIDLDDQIDAHAAKIRDQQTEPEPAEPVDRFAPLSWGDVLDGPPPAEDWLIWPLIERGQSVSLYSAPKVGKSLLILELAARLSAGQTTLGHTPDQPIRTLYLDAENTRRDLRARLHALNMSADNLSHLTYLSFPPLQPLDTIAGAVELLHLVDQYTPDLVVLDTVSRYIDGGENDSDTWLAVYSRTLVHLKARGIAVLRLDHEGKDGERGERGSSAKNGDVDASWRLTYDERRQTRTLTRKLTRTGNGPERLVLDILTPPLRHEVTTALLADPVAAVVAALDELEVPTDWGRDRSIDALSKGGYGFRTALVSQAIKLRRTAEKPVPDPSDSETPGNRFGNRSHLFPPSGTGEDITAGQTCSESVGTGREQAPAHLPVPGVPPYRGTPWEQVSGADHPEHGSTTTNPDEADLLAHLDEAASRIEWGSKP